MTDPATTRASAAAAGPTHIRYKVVAMAVLLAMVTYLDRVCISRLAPDIMRDLGLSKVQMSWVFSAFALAYAIFEIPTAWWADRWGTRRVLTRIVAWWSTFNIATAGAFNYASLLAVRFLFGAGEAGALPGVAQTFSRWIPDRERGTIQGIFFAGAASTTYDSPNLGARTTMILDTLKNIDAYEKLHPLFPAAFRHLRELLARHDLPTERTELDGERIYAVFVRGVGKASSDAALETHRRYIDIQYTVDGADRIGWQPAAACTAGAGYNEKKDVELYPGSPGTWLDVPAGHAAIFFPADAHAPMGNTGQPVTKIVIKVAV